MTDERRAEIEAVARALVERDLRFANPVGLRAGVALDLAEAARAALDRVRDARGDDEAARCEVCAEAPYPWNCERCNPSAARSPQGEDHEAGDDLWEWTRADLIAQVRALRSRVSAPKADEKQEAPLDDERRP